MQTVTPPRLMPTIRPIVDADWPAILALQAEAYHALEPESEQVLRSKLALGPDTCLVACQGDRLLGYCLAHPWCKSTPAGLYQCYPTTAGRDALYIHDVVVSPSVRGLGVARQFLRHIEQQAARLQAEQLSLVAVQGADRYWARHGFLPTHTHKSLHDYGEQAIYMRRPMRPDRASNPLFR
ncbi:MAG: GNAT family N-acetyltransferase [Aeromonadaceae bacterium]